jgi:hypothetical protein
VTKHSIVKADDCRGAKVFGIGLSRTGTSSLCDALNLLGIPTVHHPSDDQTFAELASGRYELTILRRYQGLVDIPAAAYYAQFDKVYPGSRFILTVRDVDSWLDSIEDHARRLDNIRNSEFTRFMWATVYGAWEVNHDRFAYVYELHRENARRFFRDRPADFLELDITGGEGWYQLCRFLGTDVPESPFPHKNTKQSNWVWRDRALHMTKILEQLRVRDGDVVLLDEEETGYEVDRGRHFVPFPESQGGYGGPPASDAEAIEEIERLRSAGANYFVVAWPAFWWLDHYSRFSEHLITRYGRLHADDTVVVFDLRTQPATSR